MAHKQRSGVDLEKAILHSEDLFIQSADEDQAQKEADRHLVQKLSVSIRKELDELNPKVQEIQSQFQRNTYFLDSEKLKETAAILIQRNDVNISLLDRSFQ